MKTFLVVLSFIFLFGCESPPLPIFAGEGGIICPKTSLLLLQQPETDIHSGNELIATYCTSAITPSGSELKISLVFKDEIHPNPWKDFFYRIYRRIRYGRTYDIESILLKMEPDGKLFQLDLNHVYSQNQKFQQDPVEHFDTTLGPSDLENKSLVPVLYVNTWNHMFGEKDNNPELPKQEIPLIEVRFGSRQQLDSYFGGN